MNPQIEKLYQLAHKQERRIIGLMSGTSLDGLDIALCTISGSGAETRLSLERFVTQPYDQVFQENIRRVFAQKTVDLALLTALNAQIGAIHASLINDALAGWGIAAAEVDLIASHGQTTYHAPQSLTRNLTLPNSTLQIGDGDHIAVKTGIITLSDFRQKHVAKGGEGAPLAAYGDYLLFSHEVENRFLLNIGGISNFTFLPNRDSTNKAFATDLGPGNTLMNQYMYTNFGLEMDEGGTLARRGTVDKNLLAELLREDFLAGSFPKTTGPELFNLDYLKAAQSRSNSGDLSAEDLMASLNMFTAVAIADAIKRQAVGLEQVHVYVSGGGLHNPVLMENIRQELVDIPVSSFGDLGLDPDAKEACLFALLANESVAGKADNLSAIKDSPAVCMGKISLPY